MGFQLAFNIILLMAAFLFLRWLYHHWFSKSERQLSDKLISKKVELVELLKRKEDLEDTVGITEEVTALQVEISQKEEVLKNLDGK